MATKPFTRIVVMTFQNGKGDEFRAHFEGWKHRIAGFPGCTSLRLVQDMADPDRYMTISSWDSPEDLENYRNSELFAGVWPVVKALFRQKAQAWSVSEDWSSTP